MLLDHRSEAVEHLVHGLVELALAGVALRDLFVEVMQFLV